MEKSYKIRIYPNAAQREQIARTCGCARWVYNRALEVRKAAWADSGETPHVNEVVKMIPGWKRKNPWLAEADSMALQQAVRDLGRAYDNFFRTPGKVGFPRFKSKHASRQSYRTQNIAGKGIVVADPRHVKLPKLGLVKARVSRPVEGRILSATVEAAPSGRYYVSLCCADVPEPAMEPGPVEVMGVDAGIADLAVTSDGHRYANPRAGAKLAKRLKREQRRLSRKQRGSKRHARQKRKVASTCERAADARRDCMHKSTTAIIRESQAVAVEDLNVAGMMRNHHIAGAAADASMGELRRQLEYKAKWYRRGYVEVGRFYPSSKTCSSCGHVFGGLTLSMRAWDCPECGACHDRDLNAAINIAAEGKRILKDQDGTAGHAGTQAAQAA